MLYSAADYTAKYGVTGAAIQAAYDAAVVDVGERGASLYIPRMVNEKAWVVTEPLRFGPSHGVTLFGDGLCHESAWGGTLLDGRECAGPVIHAQVGIGLSWRGFTVWGGECAVHFDGNSVEGVSSQAGYVEQVSGIAWNEGGTALRIEGTGTPASWPDSQGEYLSNDQVMSESSFVGCKWEGKLGVGARVASRQSVNVQFFGGSLGGRVGLDLIAGGVKTWGVNFGRPGGLAEPSIHVRQRGQTVAHFNEYHEHGGYHELRGDLGDIGFQGVGSHSRITLLDGSRYLMQRARGCWIDAPDFKAALFRTRDLTLEWSSDAAGSYTRPNYLPGAPHRLAS